MTELKFRAWDYNEMSYNITKLKCNNGLVEGFYLDDVYNFGHIMQYTGLKDINGKEIYEGDIIKKIGLEINFIVVFNCVSFCIQDYENPHHNLSLLDCDACFEIIGNIYENPELLEVK